MEVITKRVIIQYFISHDIHISLRGIDSDTCLVSTMIDTIRLNVENFGYVGKGEIELAPITLLIGPNNTGKSYTAMFLYASIKSLQEIIMMRKGFLRFLRFMEMKDLENLLEKLVNEYREKVQSLTKESKNRRKNEELNRLLREFVERSIELYINKLNEELNSEGYEKLAIAAIERVFSSRITDLVRRGSSEMNANIKIRGRLFELSYDLKVSIPKPGIEQGMNIDLNIKLSVETDTIVKNFEEDITKYYRFAENITSKKVISKRSLHQLLFDIIFRVYRSLEEDFGFNIRYLPASRAGILHSYRTVASALIRSVPEMPIRGAEIPSVPGILADFLAELISLEPRAINISDELKEISKLLEEVLEGSVELVRRSDISLSEPIYRSKEFEFPLSNVSSMIAELSPLDLYLRYGLIKKNDILIIEEPEAHLHPDKQAKLIEVLTLLAKRLGVRVIITTHSDVILNKLSNLVMAGSSNAPEFRAALKPEDVKIYNFRKDEGYSIVEEVKVSETGIRDDVFKKIIEELYEEHMKLYHRVQKLKVRGRIHDCKEDKD